MTQWGFGREPGCSSSAITTQYGRSARSPSTDVRERDVSRHEVLLHGRPVHTGLEPERGTNDAIEGPVRERRRPR